MQRIKTLIHDVMSDIGYYSVLCLSFILILILVISFLFSLLSSFLS
jgi:hypothetical protein